MNEKALSVFEQYDIEVTENYRIKGNYGCVTKNGRYILQEYNNSNDKMETMKIFCDGLEKQGIRTDCVVENKEGSFVSTSEDGYTYILKKWYRASDCSISNEEHLILMSKALADFHNKSQLVDINETKGFHPGLNMQKAYERHNKEIITIRNYIKKRKNKSYFEICIQKIIEDYNEQAISALEQLKEADYEKVYEESQKLGIINHGSFNYHNVLLDEDGIILINMSKINYAPQIQDLYDLLRKAMEKNNWDIELYRKMIDSYSEIKSLREKEIELIKIFFSYPEKFWKIINYYYNSNKAWYSEKNEEKLKQFQNQEANRWDFIKNMGK